MNRTITSSNGLQRMWSRIRGRYRWLFLCLLTCAASAAGFSLVQPKVYRATAHLLLSESKLARLEPQPSSLLYYELLRSYERSLKSPYLIQRTLEEFDLHKSPFLLTVEEFLRRRILEVTVFKNTRLLELTVEFSDPQLAASLANFHVKNALQFHQELELASGKTASQALKQHRDAAAEGLEAARRRLLEFRRKIRIDQLRDSFWNLLDQNYENQRELSRLQVQRARVKAKRRALEASNGLTGADLATSGSHGSGRSRRLEELAAEAGGIEVATETLQKMVRTNQRKLARLEQEKVSRESQLESLLEQLRLARDNHRALSRSYQKTVLEEGRHPIELKIMAPAIAPSQPVRPRIYRNTLLAVVFGVLLWVVAILLLPDRTTPEPAGD